MTIKIGQIRVEVVQFQSVVTVVGSIQLVIFGEKNFHQSQNM